MADACYITNYADALLTPAIVPPKNQAKKVLSGFPQRDAKVGDLLVALLRDKPEKRAPSGTAIAMQDSTPAAAQASAGSPAAINPTSRNTSGCTRPDVELQSSYQRAPENVFAVEGRPYSEGWRFAAEIGILLS